MLVDTRWLAERLEDPSLAVLDMRWREDGSGRALYEAGHIPAAVFLDWTTDIVDPHGEIAFMLAPPERFASVMERCGIGDETTVVAYADQFGSGPFRLWWACRAYGHDDVRVLDGGLDKWLAEDRPVSSEPSFPSPARWTPRPGSGARLPADADDVAAGASDPGVLVLDARPPEQFRGEAVWFETGPVPAGPDGIARTPRGDFRAGRVPWAANVPIESLYRPDFSMKSPTELRELFEAAGATADRRVITYCGVAISASALLFALVRAGFENASLYDASWEEWGRDPDVPIARG
jgi:thiosulfate/3-mercaptopyruvate sulfurtransferase